MDKECEHDWKKLYFRKTIDKPWQSWVLADELYVCEKCFIVGKMGKTNVIKLEQEV